MIEDNNTMVRTRIIILMHDDNTIAGKLVNCIFMNNEDTTAEKNLICGT